MYSYEDCVKIPPMSFVDDVIAISDCGPNSIKMNAYVQSKADTKKLKLSESKCVKMHFGKKSENCPSLKIHQKEMIKSGKERYLGDVITDDAKMDENIKMRKDKGIGIANGIISILKEVSFGVYYFEMGMLFRNSMLLSGILFNTESMCSISENHLNMLEDADKYLLRQLFNTNIGTPIESFYIELSILPVKYLVKGRRLMYYWTMLQKTENELVKRVVVAQKEFPGRKIDWVQQVSADLEFCDIRYEENEIKSMKQEAFRKVVGEKIKFKAKEYLTSADETF